MPEFVPRAIAKELGSETQQEVLLEGFHSSENVSNKLFSMNISQTGMPCSLPHCSKPAAGPANCFGLYSAMVFRGGI